MMAAFLVGSLLSLPAPEVTWFVQIEDAERFGYTSDGVRAILAWNRAVRESVQGWRVNARLDPERDAWDLALRELDAAWWAYDDLLDGLGRYEGDGEFYERYRLTNLRSVLNRIGEAAYFSGRMPPAVPLWIFREIP